MYDFLLVQWRLGKLTEAQLGKAAIKGLITQDQADVIAATERTVSL